MRLHFAVAALIAACSSHPSIGPEDGGGDASALDGAPADSSAPDGSATDTETDGTRLKARYQTVNVAGADGSQQVVKSFIAWLDTQRNEQCSPTYANDGNLHCMPSGIGAGSYFVDAQCANVVALVTPPAASCSTTTAPTPVYAASTSVVNNCTQTTLSLLGTKLSPTTYYIKSGNNCTPVGAIPQGWTFYAASGAPIDPSSFVQMTETITVAP